ncbi:hypothetical protein AQS8620_00228 [Aquimixticola soesokkakensis]|uniref:UPF0391 membrane protein AQS8620_00228 n=1 Tax=Aquimixticola soesokkakensis TaxID=1519096 RepID=A0A1Y5REH6_9RHOB|nr:DUF1328 domain-containing protein [Aquimixticola soesokkakensis]SLN14402.1 hypothetical protein AQS8620_00228 [Aquimixticola soesokkakensis]
MLQWALTFLAVALVAGFFGFGGLAASLGGIAEVLFFIFAGLSLVMLVVVNIRGNRRGRKFKSRPLSD